MNFRERSTYVKQPKDMIKAPNGSDRVGSTALPDPKLRVGSGNGSERVRRVLNLTNQ